MATKIQTRRMTNAARIALVTAPAAGEPIFCTDTKQLYFGDGSTLGGNPMSLDWANLTGIPGYVDDVLEYANLAAFPATGETGKVYVRIDTNQVYRWSGTVYVELSSAGVADTAVKLQTARTIALTGDATGSASFDGSANASIAVTVSGLAAKAPLASPALTGTPTAPTATAGTTTTQVATTAFVNAEIDADRPFEATVGNIKMNGAAAVGTAASVARGDHTHPSDTSRAPLASPALTGTPTAPTASAGTNTTQVATTAFVTAAIAVIDGGTV